MQHNSLFLSHGGGPLPLLDDPGHSQMVACLHNIAKTIPRPQAIVVVSAHWEADYPGITSSARPELVYDYYGFPPASYQIRYPAPGHPELARRIYQTLQAAAMQPQLHPQRGFDHGMFVPLKILYPLADIPCVQLSLLHSLDARRHLELGAALAGIQQPGLLVIGSGFSFHNMREFFAQATPQTTAMNMEFEDWLIHTCTDQLDQRERTERLINWQQAPHARYCHPREEHLLPLLVCCGLTRLPASRHYALDIAGKRSSMFYWEGNA